MVKKCKITFTDPNLFENIGVNHNIEIVTGNSNKVFLLSSVLVDTSIIFPPEKLDS